MKIQRLLTKNLWVVLGVGTLMVWAVFRMTPTLAYSPSSQVQTAQQEVVPVTVSQYYPDSRQQSLYDRVGGYNAIAAVVDDALPRIVNDPEIKEYFVGLSTDTKRKLRQLLVDQLCRAAGGPCEYTGRTMKVSHGGLGLSNSEFDSFVADIAASLDKFGVTQQEKNHVLAFYNGFRGQIVEK